MLWLKAFVEQLNELNVDDDGITPMENFAGTTADIDLKNHHTCSCTVYVLDAGLQVKISILPKLEPLSYASIYPGSFPFHAG